MENIPDAVSVSFFVTTIVTVLLFYKATNKSPAILLLFTGWLLLQFILGLTGFYNETNATPPRFPFLILPPLLLIAAVFTTTKGRTFLDRLDMAMLTMLHIIRIPVELILYSLYLHKAIPQLMTFEGRNFDVLAGLSAPLVYYFVFVKAAIGKNGLLLWNFICLALLLNIVVNAALSVPSVLQQFAFDQPARALLVFPFIWLPSCVVPVVLLSHLAVIRKIVNGK